MISPFDLWLPILLGAVAVFIASSIIHMVLKYHVNDFKPLPNEEALMDAMRPHAPAPGDYAFPHCTDMKERESEPFRAKLANGPVGFMTIYPNGPVDMGQSLILWFVFCLVVGIFTAYVARQALAPGADYMVVSRLTSTVAFMGYGLALLQGSIWYRRSWAATGKSVFDALVYALLTGGFFGWLWPGIG